MDGDAQRGTPAVVAAATVKIDSSAAYASWNRYRLFFFTAPPRKAVLVG